MGQALTVDQSERALRAGRFSAMHVAEKRRHSRVKVDMLGRFMLPNHQEYPCQVRDMSPGGAALYTKVQPNINDRVIAYIEEIGRIEGRTVRHIEGGFAMTIETTLHRRDKLAAKLTWLANKHVLNLPEDRRFERVEPKATMTRLQMVDGRSYDCRVIDVSLSGAAIATAVRPAIGSYIVVGSVRGKVVRHLEEGVAIEFSALSSIDEVEGYLR